jgi:predicted ArsR family transcriptional regulator
LVLGELQAVGRPIGVAELGRRLGLHANTARFHLTALTEAGLAQRSTESSGRGGRPRVLYAATPDSAGVGRRSYRLLAEILAGHLAAHARRPAAAAREAGREWGRCLAARPAPFERPDAAGAVRQLVHVLAGIGFLPEVVDEARLRLHHCPFREAAPAYGQVVCAVHLGLMQGVLAESGAPISAARVEPFVDPAWCAVQLEPAG